MKKTLLAITLVSIVTLSGCWCSKKVQHTPAKEMAGASAVTGQKNTMLSFFDDRDAMEQAEALVLDDAAVSMDEDSFVLADATHKIEGENCLVYFDYDSACPRQDQRQAISELNQKIDQWTKEGYQIAFCGHACRYSPKATDVYNMALSEQRAQALTKCCSALDTEKVKVFGVGNEQPMIVSDMTKEGQAPNRRVEIYPIAVTA